MARAKSQRARPGGALETYRRKRDFKRTPEPRGVARTPRGRLRYVVQKHDARRLHYDFRLEHGGVLKSWAVPKEPSYDPRDRRLAVRTEDHPLDYGSFEGEIPEGEYGAGSVVIWDRGTWAPFGDPARGLADGKLDFELSGERLAGRWTLVRMAARGGARKTRGTSKANGKENWLLIKRTDSDRTMGAGRVARGGAKRAGGASKSRPKSTAKRKTQRAAAASRARSESPPTATLAVRLTHPDKVLFPDVGITKRELADYWEQVAPAALPGLEGRPLTLYRCPNGVGTQCFFQKHVGAGVPNAVPRVRVRDDEEPYAMVDGLPALLSLVQIGALELHAWGSRAEHLDQPDVVVLDLDPDEKLGWSAVAKAALDLKQRIEALGLAAFVRLTGGKGLHVVVPTAPGPTWPAVKRFARTLVDEMVRDAPKRFTASLSKEQRGGKIFVDYLRNDREATAIASYSPRARAGAPVALPIEWDELEPKARRAPRFSVRDVPKLVRERARDPWRGFDAARRPLV